MSHARSSIIRFGICLILLVNAVSCTVGAKTDAPPGQPEATLPSRVVVEIPEGDDAILLFAGWESERQFYERLINEFNQEHTDITIQFAALADDQIGGGADIDGYYRMLASGGDASLIGGNLPLNAAHYFLDLQPLIDSDAAFDSHDFWPGAMDACRDRENRLLGIPVRIGFRGIYYSIEAFDSVGLPHPYPGWTWDDFRSAVTILAKQEGERIRYGYAERSPSLMSALVSASIDENGGEIEPEALLPITEWYIDLVKARIVYLDPGGIDRQGSQEGGQGVSWLELFPSENRPAMWSGSFGEAIPGERASPGSDPFTHTALIEYGFAPYPVAAGGSMNNTTPAWVECAAISAGTNRPYQAWEWLKFLSQHWLVKNQNNAWEIALAPGRVSVTDNSAYWQNLPDQLEPFIRYILQHAWYGPAHPEASALALESLSKAAIDQVDLVATLNDAKTQFVKTPEPTPDRTPIAAATPKPTLAPGVKEILYFYNAAGEERQAIQAAAAAYNRIHPNVIVEVITDFDIAPNMERLPEITGNFDCFTSTPFNWQNQKLDGLYNLNSLLEAEGSLFIQDYDPILLDTFSFNGALYALPSFSDLPVMAYNADLLAKRGLNPPSNDWSFEDFIEAIHVATSTDTNDRSYGFLYNSFDDLFFAGRGTVWVDVTPDPPVPMLNSPGFATTLDWINDRIEAGVLLVQRDDATVRQAISNGQVAFWTSMLEEPGNWFYGQPPDFNLRIAPMPAMEYSNRMFAWSVKGHFITKRTTEPQLCWDWFKYLSEQTTVYRGIPARKSVAESPEWEAVVGKESAEVYRQAISNAIRASEGEKFTPLIWPLYLWQNQAVAAMLNGEDYHHLLPELQKRAEDYMTCMLEADFQALNDAELTEEINRCKTQTDAGGSIIKRFP